MLPYEVAYVWDDTAPIVVARFTERKMALRWAEELSPVEEVADCTGK